MTVTGFNATLNDRPSYPDLRATHGEDPATFLGMDELYQPRTVEKATIGGEA